MAISYGEYVSRMTLRKPSLAALSSFLNNQPGTICNSCIRYAEVEKNGQIGPSLKGTTREFVSRAGSTPAKSILMVIENIHSEDIEILGSSFGIDPFFFAGHIASSYRGIENSPPPPLLALPPSQIASREYFNIHYQKVLDLGAESDLGHVPYHLTLRANIPRNIRRLPALSDRSIGLLRGCISVVKHCLPNGLWLCLILVDPDTDIMVQSKHDFYSCHGISQIPRKIAPESISDLPNYAKFQIKEKPGQFPQHLKPCDEIMSFFDVSPPGWKEGGFSILSFAYHPIRIINQEWMLYELLMSRYIKYYEYTLPSVSSRLEHFEKYDVVDLHRWRRRSQQTILKLQMTRRFVEYWHTKEYNSNTMINDPADLSSKPNSEDTSLWKLLLMDITHLEEQIGQHAESLEALNPIMTSLVQLIDSHKSISQSEDIKRLTYIAIAFIPLSYITGIFSMSGQYSPGGESFWVYWVTALPVAVLIVGFLALESRIPVLFKLLEQTRKRWRLFRA